MTSRGNLWHEGDEWRVSPDPELSIGTVEGEEAYQLFRLSGAARLTNGDIVVMNGGTQELRFYDDAGRYLRSAGGDGEGPGEFRSPSLLYVLGGDTTVVWDARLQRVSLFDAAGAFARSFTLQVPGTIYRASGLFDDRTLLALKRVRSGSEPQSGLLRGASLYALFNLAGDSLATLGSFPDREDYVQSSDRGVVTMALVLGRTTVTATHGTTLYVGTNDSYAIDQYDRGGRLVRSVRRDVGVPVSDEMFAAEVEAQSKQWPEQAREMWGPVFEAMPKPQSLPHYSAIETDPDGSMWVRHYSSVTAPMFEWTVFDPEGRMLGDVTLPERLVVYEIGRDYVLGRWRDESDVEYVRLHRLNRGSLR